MKFLQRYIGTLCLALGYFLGHFPVPNLWQGELAILGGTGLGLAWLAWQRRDA